MTKTNRENPEGLVVWKNDTHLVMLGAGLFTGAMYTLYKRVGKTDTWERQPQNGVTLYKTLEAAKAAAALSPQPRSKPADTHDAIPTQSKDSEEK